MPERLSFCPNCLPAMTASNGVASTQKSTHKAVAGSVGPFTAALTTNGSLYRRLDERAGASGIKDHVPPTCAGLAALSSSTF